MRVTALVASLRAGVIICALGSPATAQDLSGALDSTGEFGYQTLMEGVSSRSGFPPAYDCPSITRHVPGRPWNEWTRDNLPDGCRDVPPKQDTPVERSRFEIRTYIDIGTVGWDNNYSSVIPSIGGFHVSFANLSGWKLGAGGVLASFSPMFDVKSGTRRYQVSPRLNLFNVNRKVKELTPTSFDLYFSVEATRELFLPADALNGSTQFNNVFFGFAVSPRGK